MGEPRFAHGSEDAATLLAGLLGEPVEIGHACPACGSSAHGRPFLKARRDLSVSIAHAAELTLVGVAASGRLGVDLERSDSVPPPGYAGIEEWVRAEAYLKATGQGLSGRVDAEPVLAEGRLDLGPDYVAAWVLLS